MEPLACAGTDPKVAPVVIYHIYLLLGMPVAAAVIVLTSGDAQLLSGPPENAADGGDVTVIAFGKVVSDVHPQLLVSNMLTGTCVGLPCG